MKPTNKTLEYYMSLPYAVTLSALSPEDSGGWLARIPSLEGCWTDGETQIEALEHLQEAKQGWLETALELGMAIPEPEFFTV